MLYFITSKPYISKTTLVHCVEVKAMANDTGSRKRIFVTLVCLIQCCVSVGLIYGFSVMYAELIDVFSTSRLSSALIQGIFNFIALGGGVLWTWPIHYLGIGSSMAFGALLAFVGFGTSAFASDSKTIVACTGVICGAGLSIGFMAPFAVVGLLYKTDASFPIALLTVAGSVGQMAMPQIYRVLLDLYHWSGAFILLAGIALHGLPCGVIIQYSNDIFIKENNSNTNSGTCCKKLCFDPVTLLFLVIVLLIFASSTFKTCSS
ncbi:monocarboxylate transporter 3-like [Ruditapes philippinarum]|uniref:monocarboxylate transporter 3-like n=1 Tax=Ruditapes philippinarum TaxID=129788 RepID=UPI00295B793B|nr:monocarboxylate transporter 3-like [Ruditapes philippinarum]